MPVSKISQLARNTGRFAEVVTILAKYGLADWLTNVDNDWLKAVLRDVSLAMT